MDTVKRTLSHARRSATGLRKITPPMLGAIQTAEAHAFTATMHPGQALAAFKAAAPFLGLRPSVVHAIDWLFRFTVPIDWQPSARPIVWPSAAMQQQEMGLGVSQVKNVNRHLVELGLIVMRDSPNGKRYGRRGPEGRIIEAYGFDLSPLASRFDDFQAIAQAGREERARMAAQRRRATIARNGIRQLAETAGEEGIGGEEWGAFRQEAAMASRGVAARTTADDMEVAVLALERVQREMRLWLETFFATQQNSCLPVARSSVDINPKEPKNRPHITTTNQLLNLKDTVIAAEENRLRPAPISRPVHKTEPRVENVKQREAADRTDSGPLLKITPTELMKLAPRLKPYLRDSFPKWPEIVDAADWLRDELGISKSIWGSACLTMGREQASIAVAIVSAKPADHFRGSPGAYFHGMVSKAKAGELHLARTIWAMRGQGEHRREGIKANSARMGTPGRPATLTPDQRQVVAARLDAGGSCAAMVRELGTSRMTIMRTRSTVSSPVKRDVP